MREPQPDQPSTRRWQGPCLLDVLALAEPLPTAQYVRVGAGEFITPLSLAQAEAALPADTLDGQPLTAAQGAPWRLTLPGKRRFMNIKGVDRLEVVAEPGADNALAVVRERNRAHRSQKRGQV